MEHSHFTQRIVCLGIVAAVVLAIVASAAAIAAYDTWNYATPPIAGDDFTNRRPAQPHIPGQLGTTEQKYFL